MTCTRSRLPQSRSLRQNHVQERRPLMQRLLQRFDDRLSPPLRRRAGRAHDTTNSAMMRIALSITLAMLMLSFIGTAAAAGPNLKVIGPTEGAVIQGTDVTVQFE